MFYFYQKTLQGVSMSSVSTNQVNVAANIKPFKKITVVGAGQMGAGIAQVVAQSGVGVLVVDTNEEALRKCKQNIEKSLQKLMEKGKLEFSPADITSKISLSTALSDASSSQLVIEAVSENELLKTKIFSELDKICPPDTIFASNTSSLPITRLAASTSRPDKFIGMHFMNPVPIMTLVEIIKGHATSEETYLAVEALSKNIGKTTICSQDYPGFVVNRVLMPMINEAFFTLMEGIASAEHIDLGMKLGTNQPMGPLALADFIGLDTCYAIMKVLHDGLGDSKYRPCPLLKRYVDAGKFGKKSGQGVYKYN
jgi:3-hydroxybutyryl-CoA dehydrogenase